MRFSAREVVPFVCDVHSCSNEKLNHQLALAFAVPISQIIDPLIYNLKSAYLSCIHSTQMTLWNTPAFTANLQSYSFMYVN